jgi:hypothetical protein
MKKIAGALEEMFGGRTAIHAPRQPKAKQFRFPYHLDLTSEEAELVDCAFCKAVKHADDHVQREQFDRLHRRILGIFEEQD